VQRHTIRRTDQRGEFRRTLHSLLLKAEPPLGRRSCLHRLVPGRFVIRATHERGVGVPSSRSLSTASRKANQLYAAEPPVRIELF
jgi:hypothetical protein